MSNLILLKDLKKTVKNVLYEDTSGECSIGSAVNPFDGKCYSIEKIPENLPMGPLNPETVLKTPGLPSNRPTDAALEKVVPKSKVKTLVKEALLEITDPNVLSEGPPVDCGPLSFIVGFAAGRFGQGAFKLILKASLKVTRTMINGVRGRITNQGMNAAMRAALEAEAKATAGFAKKLLKFALTAKLAVIAVGIATATGAVWAVSNTIRKVNTEGGMTNFMDKCTKFYNKGDGKGFMKWYAEDAWLAEKNWCFWSGFSASILLTRKNFDLGIKAAFRTTKAAKNVIKTLPFKWFKKTISKIPEDVLGRAPAVRELFVMNKLKVMLGRPIEQPIKIIVKGADTVMEVATDQTIKLSRANYLTLKGLDGGETLMKELLGDGNYRRLQSLQPNRFMSKNIQKTVLDRQLKEIARVSFDAAKKAGTDAAALARRTPAARLINATLKTLDEAVPPGNITADFHSRLANRLGGAVLKETEEVVDALSVLIKACKQAETEMLTAAAALRKTPNFPVEIMRSIKRGADPGILKKALKDWSSKQSLEASERIMLETNFDTLVNKADVFFKQKNELVASVGGFNQVVKAQIEGMQESLGKNIFEDVLGHPGLRNKFTTDIGEVLLSSARYLKPDDWIGFSGAFASLGLGSYGLIHAWTKLRPDDAFNSSFDIINKARGDGQKNIFAGTTTGDRVSIIDNLVVNYLNKHQEKIIKIILGTYNGLEFEKNRDEIKAGKYIFNDVLDFAFRDTDDPDGGMRGCWFESNCSTGWIQAQAEVIEEEEIEKILEHWRTTMFAMKEDDKVFGSIGQWFVKGSSRFSPSVVAPNNTVMMMKFKSIFFHFFEPYIAYMKNPKGFKNRQGKEIKEMKKMSLKEIVKEVIKEESGRGYSPSQYYDTEEEQNPEDIDVEYRNLLDEFDQDPGYDFAVHIGKCLVQNKETMRELLELALQVPELRSELIQKIKQMS